MMTKNQGQALAAFIHELRNEWDAPGIVAQLAKCQHLNAYEVAHALLRLAENPAAKTPGALTVTGGEHWREKSRESARMTAPRREDQCLACGRHLDQCSETTGCGVRERAVRPADPDTRTAAITAARQAIAGPGVAEEETA